MKRIKEGKKLLLSAEKIRALDDGALRQVGGGNCPKSVPTHTENASNG